MYIASSAVRMNSSRDYSESYYKSTTSASWNVLTGAYQVENNTDCSDSSQASSSQENGNLKSNTNSFSDTFDNLRQRFEETNQLARVDQTAVSSDTSKVKSSIMSMRQQMINYLLKLLFGEKADPFDSICQNQASNDVSSSQVVDIVNNGIGGYSETFFHYEESESVTFTTSASVTTADGQTIDVDMELSLSRSFVNETSDYIDYGQPLVCDPLVINFDSDSSCLTSQKFYFDLDSDGNKESISMAGNGSGFLALDSNEDGVINNGSELFGTKSGDGFADLAAYDEDGNGWIDEADAIFSKLKIYYKDDSGNDQLIGLGKASVGAIYLGSKDSQFSLTNQDNSVNAYVRKTGLFLYEKGMAGTIQQVDLAVKEEG